MNVTKKKYSSLQTVVNTNETTVNKYSDKHIEICSHAAVLER